MKGRSQSQKPEDVIRLARELMPGDSNITFGHKSHVYKMWRGHTSLGQRTAAEVERYHYPANVLASIARRAIVAQVRR